MTVYLYVSPLRYTPIRRAVQPVCHALKNWTVLLGQRLGQPSSPGTCREVLKSLHEQISDYKDRLDSREFELMALRVVIVLLE